MDALLLATPSPGRDHTPLRVPSNLGEWSGLTLQFRTGSVIETMASERDKWPSKTQNSRVYSAGAGACWQSYLQRLSVLALFWVSFIHGKLSAQKAQIPPLQQASKIIEAKMVIDEQQLFKTR